MISKNSIKLIHALATKKGRDKHGLFVAEGPKVTGDFLRAGFRCKELYEDADDVSKASFLQHPQGVLGVFYLPDAHNDEPVNMEDELVLALDGVQDPGNLGTIIRIADWFGITHIYCSQATADCWNPKVVQATMGSLARVKVRYTALDAWIDSLPEGTPVYGTLLDGENIYSKELTPHGVIVMGNEGNGLSDEIRRRVNRRLLIPSYPQGRVTADSLNVAIATAIACAEFRRRG